MKQVSKKYLFPVLFGAIAASLAGCNFAPKLPIDKTIAPSVAAPVKLQADSTAIQKSLVSDDLNKSQPAWTTSTKPTKTVKVTLYKSDSQCQKLIPQKAVVPAGQPIVATVGEILAHRDTADFSLSGYRVNVDNGIATVDLRVSPQQKRQIASLSNCEQFALFGSLRKTLTSNQQWQIKQVRFTQKGQPIVF